MVPVPSAGLHISSIRTEPRPYIIGLYYLILLAGFASVNFRTRFTSILHPFHICFACHCYLDRPSVQGNRKGLISVPSLAHYFNTFRALMGFISL